MMDEGFAKTQEHLPISGFRAAGFRALGLWVWGYCCRVSDSGVRGSGLAKRRSSSSQWMRLLRTVLRADQGGSSRRSMHLTTKC